MDSNMKLGLYRHVSFNEREWIEGQLSVLFQDIFDTIDDLREHTRDFEKLLHTIFHGEERP